MKTITGATISGHTTALSTARMITSAMTAKTTRRQNQIFRLRCCSRLSAARRAARRFAYSSRGAVKVEILSFKVSKWRDAKLGRDQGGHDRSPFRFEDGDGCELREFFESRLIVFDCQADPLTMFSPI